MADSLENQYDNDKFIDYYKILDIDIEANTDVIKNSYIKLAKKYHPDQINGNSEMFQLVSKAYEVLSNKENRKEYDLYYLKKSFNDLKEDNFFTLKDNYNDFIIENDKKKLTVEEIDKLYDEVFKDKVLAKDKTLDVSETTKRLNDISLERETLEIEENDETLKNFIQEHNDVNVNDIYDYIKSTNAGTSSHEIVQQTLGTIDTLPGYLDSGYSSFINENDTMGSSYFSELDNGMQIKNPKNDINKIDMNNFNDWRQTRKQDGKLNSEDIDMFLSRRKQEEEKLLSEVETNLIQNVKKRGVVETFLKTKTNILEEDIKKVESTNNIKIRNK
jgi:curved DNA-binding protein CbpA